VTRAGPGATSAYALEVLAGHQIPDDPDLAVMEQGAQGRDKSRPHILLRDAIVLICLPEIRLSLDHGNPMRTVSYRQCREMVHDTRI
jgi:hypothetical protein